MGSKVKLIQEVQATFDSNPHGFNEWETKFVEDMISRLERWGDDVLISPRQEEVLEKLLHDK